MAPRQANMSVRASSVVALLRRSPSSVGSSVSTAATTPELEINLGDTKEFQARTNKRKAAVGCGGQEQPQKRSVAQKRTEKGGGAKPPAKGTPPGAIVMDIEGGTESEKTSAALGGGRDEVQRRR